MAALMKHWREASTLILITSCHPSKIVSPVFVNGSNSQRRSLLKGTDYEMLLLKRSPKSKFMPNMYVFPGGVAADVDFSSEWIGVFDFLGRDQRQNIFDFLQRGGEGTPMFSRIREPKFSNIPSEVAFRICAIRETFEESGVLLVRDASKNRDNWWPNLWDKPSEAGFIKDQSVINEWRSKVDKDPEEFLRMCQKLKLVPDVWSLYEWSNWLTPTFEGRRFDTAFFICCVQGKPHAVEDEGETVHSQWTSPSFLLSQYKDGKANIAPPQLYESFRLIRFNISDLLKFSWHRSQYRVGRWLPVLIGCADGSMMLMPGDSLYPADVKPEGQMEKCAYKETISELFQTCQNIHRVIVTPSEVPWKKLNIFCNIELPCNHVSPLNSNSYFEHLESVTPASHL